MGFVTLLNSNNAVTIALATTEKACVDEDFILLMILFFSQELKMNSNTFVLQRLYIRSDFPVLYFLWIIF